MTRRRGGIVGGIVGIMGQLHERLVSLCSEVVSCCRTSHLSLLAWYSSTDAIATLDHVGLEADWARGSVKLEEKTTGVAQHRAVLVSSPERGGRGRAILTYWLLGAGRVISL